MWQLNIAKLLGVQILAVYRPTMYSMMFIIFEARKSWIGDAVYCYCPSHPVGLISLTSTPALAIIPHCTVASNLSQRPRDVINRLDNQQQASPHEHRPQQNEQSASSPPRNDICASGCGSGACSHVSAKLFQSRLTPGRDHRTGCCVTTSGSVPVDMGCCCAGSLEVGIVGLVLLLRACKWFVER
jgi:hypothetical protein